MQETERQAFDELIRLYYDYVSGFLRKTTLDETLSEDLTQETFLKNEPQHRDVRSRRHACPEGHGAAVWLVRRIPAREP